MLEGVVVSLEIRLDHGATDADADGDDLVLVGEHSYLDRRTDTFGKRGGAFHVGLGGDDHEFLAADAAEQVDVADRPGQSAGEVSQHAVAAGQQVAFVDALEMIDVDEEDRQRRGVAVAGAQFTLGEAVHGPAIGQGSSILFFCSSSW